MTDTVTVSSATDLAVKLFERSRTQDMDYRQRMLLAAAAGLYASREWPRIVAEYA